ncbi:MAG: hypothetical protein GVY17_04825 [Cyanobacteria bacterium]|jgi:hypothetical protein|nr:hypothetical protein [Cyanobacteria bacterium GSL.Bin21]
MNLDQQIAQTFRMSETVWQKHANPWSVWTRTTVLPLLAIAIWSRQWWGWWSILPVAITFFWTWLNPRLFKKPASTNNWASKAVLGERVWLNRHQIPVPQHHHQMPNLLNLLSALGLPFFLGGLLIFNLWSTVLGACLVYCGKFWFLDRMVWLYEDMKEATPEYRSWLY